MNVGNVGATTYNPWTRSAAAPKTNARDSNFAQTIGNQGSSTHIELHGVSDEMKEQGYKLIGAWGGAKIGNSTSVYKPADFDENNPVYLVKTWDAQGNVTEKEINMKEVNPNSSDVYEMYAYSCYLADSGKYPNAQLDFMRSIPAGNDMSKFGLQSFDDIYCMKVDWMRIIKGWMDMQYGAGNMKGYLDFKGFYDFLGK